MGDQDDEPTDPIRPDDPLPTLDPERIVGWASDVVSRNRRTVVLAAGALVLLVLGGLFWSATRPAGLGMPRGLVAEGRACGPPRCKVIKVAIDLHWEPPEGGEYTVYRLYRDGGFLTEIGSLSTDYEDTDVAIGEIHTYRLQAVGPEREGVRSYPVKGQVPEPPVVSAQLFGDYDVVLTVKEARNFPGRDRPGDRHTARWGSEPKCKPPAGACTTVLTGLKATLRFTGNGYVGTIVIRGVRLRGEVGRLPGRIRLTPTEAAWDGSAWRVTSFRGTETVTRRANGLLRVALAGTARP